MALPALQQTWNEALAPLWAAITPLTLLILAWKARGFVDNLVNNHLAHIKNEVVDEIHKGVAEEKEGHQKIESAVKESTIQIVSAINARK